MRLNVQDWFLIPQFLYRKQTLSVLGYIIRMEELVIETHFYVSTLMYESHIELCAIYFSKNE